MRKRSIVEWGLRGASGVQRIQKSGGHWRKWGTSRGQICTVFFDYTLFCLFTHMLPSCVFAFCVYFIFLPILSPHLLLWKCMFISNMFYVHVLNVFISGVYVSLSLTWWSQHLLDIQGDWASWCKWVTKIVARTFCNKNKSVNYSCLTGCQITYIGSNISILYQWYQIIRMKSVFSNNTSHMHMY